MTTFEYKVVPAPNKGKKARGVKGTEARFAFALEDVMNELAMEGWEYQRAEMLPSEERSGLTGTQTTFRNVLVFRRPRQNDISAFEPKLLERPAAPVAQPAPVPETDPRKPDPLILHKPVSPTPSLGSLQDDSAPEPEEEITLGLPVALRNRARLFDPLPGLSEDENTAAR